MKKSRFTDGKIAFALKQAELWTSVPDVCRKLGILTDMTNECHGRKWIEWFYSSFAKGISFHRVVHAGDSISRFICHSGAVP